MGGKRKKEMRAEMKRVLANFDLRWINAASGEISNRLSQLIAELPVEIEHVLAWSSFFSGEVDLSRFIEQGLESYSIYLPRVLDDCSMTFVSIGDDWLENTQPGVFGVPEPTAESGSIYLPENAASTVVLVPGMAFDRRGSRLGRGKGCYDRFLSRAGMVDAIKIGVCFSLQIQPDVPTDSFDIVMNWVCCEDESFSCNSLEGD